MQPYAWICCMMKSNVSKIEHWEALKQEVNKEGYYTKFISQEIIPLTTYTSKYEIAADFCVFRRTLGQSELTQRLVAQQLKYRSLNIRQPVIMHNYGFAQWVGSDPLSQLHR